MLRILRTYDTVCYAQSKHICVSHHSGTWPAKEPVHKHTQVHTHAHTHTRTHKQTNMKHATVWCVSDHSGTWAA
jgi:hypothetical protein